MGAACKNLQAFESLKRQVEAASRGAMLPELNKRVGAALMKLVADEFRQSADPYGKPWAPLARERTRNKKARLRAEKAGKKSKGQKPLIDTGRMRASVVYLGDGQKVRLIIPVDYASYHQDGTEDGRIPQRMMLPTRGLPERWQLSIAKEAAGVINKHFGKR